MKRVCMRANMRAKYGLIYKSWLADYCNIKMHTIEYEESLVLFGFVEYHEGRDWVDDHLNFNSNDLVSVFEITIRALGGLLSIYHLTGDAMFLGKAVRKSSTTIVLSPMDRTIN